MNKTMKWVLIIAAVLAVLLIGWKLAVGNKDADLKVATEKASKRTIIETVTASGNIYPEVEVKISPDISGEVTQLMVEEGDSVKKGQVLATIFADIYALQRDQAAADVNRSRAVVANSRASLEALRANLDQAQAAYNRNQTLYEQKVISKSEFEQYETALASARSNYRAAQQNIKSLEAGVNAAQTGLTRANKDLGRATLVAPMSGVISSLKIKRGERVAGNSFNIGTEMMTVADMSVLEARVEVGESDIVKVNIGDSADVEVDAYNNRKFKGVVTQIASSTSGSSSLQAATNQVTNYEVRIRLIPDSYKDLVDPARPKKFPFRPGMNASAEIKTRRVDNAISIPIVAVNARVKGSDQSLADKKKEENESKPQEDEMSSAAVPADDEMEEVVYVLQPGNTVKKVIVKSGIQDINYIEIKNGLKGGEEIVVAPYAAISKDLKDGAKVKVVTKEQLFEKKK